MSQTIVNWEIGEDLHKQPLLLFLTIKFLEAIQNYTGFLDLCYLVLKRVNIRNFKHVKIF